MDQPYFDNYIDDGNDDDKVNMTGFWRDVRGQQVYFGQPAPKVNMDESQLMGSMSSALVWPWVSPGVGSGKTNHWVFNSTALADGDIIAQYLMGYEVNVYTPSRVPKLAYSTDPFADDDGSFELLTSEENIVYHPFPLDEEDTLIGMTLWTPQSTQSGMVFNGGSIQWSWFLERPTFDLGDVCYTFYKERCDSDATPLTGIDQIYDNEVATVTGMANVRQITKNILDCFTGRNNYTARFTNTRCTPEQ